MEDTLPLSPKLSQFKTLRVQSLPRNSLSQRTLTGAANLAKHLPTSSLVAFQLLIPIFTRNGVCDSATRPLTLSLLVLLSLWCFLTCFTDTVKTSDGRLYHGFATFSGIRLHDYQNHTSAPPDLPDLRAYKIKFIDFVHAGLSGLVFGAVAFRDKHVLSCFYRAPTHETLEVLDLVPLIVLLFCSLFFAIFPSRRYGVGCPTMAEQNERTAE